MDSNKDCKIFLMADYVGKKKRKPGKFKSPDKAALWIEIARDEDGKEKVFYDATPDFFNTKEGRQFLASNLASIVVDLCQEDNPALIWELIEQLHEMASEEED